MKPVNQKAWFLVLPVLVLVAISAVIPLMTVVNYSVQDTFGNNQFFWAATAWYEQVLHSERFWNALAAQPRLLRRSSSRSRFRSASSSRSHMPRKGWGVAVCLVLMALPLLIPWNVVGTIWQVFGRVDIGLLGAALAGMGIDYNYVQDPIDAWATLIVMDVWHWTSLVALLAYAGLVSIPDAYYQAARIDGASRWAVFRHIQLPKMSRVLTIAILLRFMDSFMIYTEPFVVTGGGPGNSTTFLSIDLVQMAVGQFDLGPAAAMSIIYFLIILLFSLGLLRRDDARRRRQPTSRRARHEAARSPLRHHPGALHPLPARADLLARQHELQDQHGDHRRGFSLWPAEPDARATTRSSSPTRAGTPATSTRSSTSCSTR